MPLTENFDKNILDKIKEGKIKPKPRWVFLFKEYIIWFFCALLLIVGGLAFSVVFYLVANDDWDVYEKVSGNLLEFTWLSLPYLWIIFFVMFLIGAQYYLKHTKSGYRFQIWMIAASTILSSMFLGAIFYNIGAAKAIDRVLWEKVPAYGMMNHHHFDRWKQPEKGLLAGQIESIDAVGWETRFKLSDLDGDLWNVRASGKFFEPMPELRSGLRVRMIGQDQGGYIFLAEKILPARPPFEGMFFMRCRFGDSDGCQNQNCPCGK